MELYALETRLEALKEALGNPSAGIAAAAFRDSQASAQELPGAEAEEKSAAYAADPLTKREREVLGLIAKGNSTKIVAANLGITFKTAACHRYHVMDKLGIHETASLVRYAIRAGLLQP